MPDVQALIDEVGPVLDTATERCTAGGRDDLAEKVRVAAVRVRRPSTVVCVVGEYKQGKSLLLNAVLGSDACPVHDDLATSALTILYRSDEPTAHVRRSENGEVVVEEVSMDRVAQYATEQGAAETRRSVVHVEVGLRSPVLDQGVVLIDTPGVGGLTPGYREAVLGFLPYADVLVFVSDASAELSRSEMDFLESAAQLCPNVLFALTKVDLYGEWRRIAELDEAHLRGRGLPTAVLPISSSLRRTATQHGDHDLDEESGVPRLLDIIERDVISNSRVAAATRALGEARKAVSLIHAALSAEREALIDPETGRQHAADLKRAKQQLAELRATGSRWGVVLQDGFADLRSGSDFQLRSAIRELLRDAEAELDDADPGEGWEEFTERLRVRVAGKVQEVAAALEQGAADVAERVTSLLSESAVDMPELDWTFDVDDLWESVGRKLSKQAGVFSTGLSALRGLQSGVIMLGLLGQVVGFAVIAPVMLGGGTVLGVRQVMEERKRRVGLRRQEARTMARQFLEQVQFEIGNHLQGTVADLHRGLRDVVVDRINELERACRQSLAAAERSLKEHVEGREERITWLDTELAQLSELMSRTEILERELSAPSDGEQE